MIMLTKCCLWEALPAWEEGLAVSTLVTLRREHHTAALEDSPAEVAELVGVLHGLGALSRAGWLAVFQRVFYSKSRA